MFGGIAFAQFDIAPMIGGPSLSRPARHSVRDSGVVDIGVVDASRWSDRGRHALVAAQCKMCICSPLQVSGKKDQDIEDSSGLRAATITLHAGIIHAFSSLI
jgi:hypothetical protein